jgi:hypothetical protein
VQAAARRPLSGIGLRHGHLAGAPGWMNSCYLSGLFLLCDAFCWLKSVLGTLFIIFLLRLSYHWEK